MEYPVWVNIIVLKTLEAFSLSNIRITLFEINFSNLACK